MSAFLNAAHDFLVGLLFDLLILDLIVLGFLVAALVDLGLDRFKAWNTNRLQDRDLQQRVEDWPKPVPSREDPVDFGSAISGKDFLQFHIDRRVG